MAPFLYCLLYAGGILFLAGSIVRAVQYAKQPIHLRWEIYPVPHGTTGEAKVMVPEILFLKGLWEFNRPMWLVSYPFHLGLYLLSGAGALMVLAALAPAAFFPVLQILYHICGYAGAVLGLAGSIGLLVRRSTAPELRNYSSSADFFNLAWFALTYVLLIAGEAVRPAGSAGLLRVLRGAVSFDTSVPVPGLLALGLASGAALVAYIPMTHMAHFIAKYFTYHQVRWDEKSPVAGGMMEKRMAEYLMYRPTWSAPHVGAGNGRTWADIATTNPTREAGK